MKLYIRQRVFSLKDKYNITDAAENPVYQVEGEWFSFGAKLYLCDLAGRELYRVEQELFHFLPRYTLFRGDMAVASIKKNFTLFGHSLSVDSQYGHFEIEGSVFGWEFRILRDGTVQAGIDKAVLSWGDTYELDISNQVSDPAFICALVIAIDNCAHNEGSGG